MYEQSLEVPIDTIRQEEGNLQDPEIHEVGDIPQVSGRDIEDLRNGQMEMSGERMVSRVNYTEFNPKTPERRQLLGSRRDEQTVPAGHWERRSSTSEEEILRGVTRGPSIFQESTIRGPEDSNVIPPTSQMTSSSAMGGVQTYGGGPTGPSGITFPSTGYVPRRQTTAGGGGDSPSPGGSEDRGDRRRSGGNGGGHGNGNGNGNGGGCGNGNGNGNSNGNGNGNGNSNGNVDGDENGNRDHESSISSHRGLPGLQGPMGMQGIQGIQGLLGPQGVPGMAGRTRYTRK